MNKTIIAALLLATPVHADDRLAITSTAIMADSLSTYFALRQPGLHESNPILGSHPSAGKQALFAAAKLGINWVVLRNTSEQTQHYWTVAVVVVEGAASVNNMVLISKYW